MAGPEVNDTTLVMADGATGGQAAVAWDSPADANYDRVRDQVLVPKGLTEAQVRIVWVKQANPGPAGSCFARRPPEATEIDPQERRGRIKTPSEIGDRKSVTVPIY